MLQGDTNAPATMIGNMTAIFGDRICEIVWVYLDDVIVFSQIRQQHIEHLREVFKRLEIASFYLKLQKCQFTQKWIKILEHTIENGKISVTKEQIVHILDGKIPMNRKQQQSFIGLLNYGAPHFPHTSTVAAPLTELTG